MLDRSWALQEVEKRFKEKGSTEGGDVVFGEMDVCFHMVVTVANYSCLEEWKRILGLVLTCRRAVRAREQWFAGFIDLLRRQMERCEDVEGGLFDMSDEVSRLQIFFFRSSSVTDGKDNLIVSRLPGDGNTDLDMHYREEHTSRTC